jgi:antitoxin PrlF
MKTSAQVSEKGQVTIPKALRDRLGIRPGEVLEFREDRGMLIATKATPRDPVDEVFGIIKSAKPTDEFMEEIRGKPDAV